MFYEFTSKISRRREGRKINRNFKKKEGNKEIITAAIIFSDTMQEINNIYEKKKRCYFMVQHFV